MIALVATGLRNHEIAKAAMFLGVNAVNAYIRTGYARSGSAAGATQRQR